MEPSVTNTLVAEKAALEKIERDKAMHKRAAREFFNFLEEAFPPNNTQDYWERTSARVCDVYKNAGKPKLLLYLLTAAMQYLEDVAKESESDEKERVPDN